MNNGVKSIPGKYIVQSPLMMKSAAGLYVNIFEAAVVNYPVMRFVNVDEKLNAIVPNACIMIKPTYKRPVSPWRTMISDDARDIVSSK
jgi:hypothetical protein